MQEIDRVPAIPLIANDPYFSVWMPGDTLTDEVAVHWTGVPKPITGQAVIDGVAYQYLGRSKRPAL